MHMRAQGIINWARGLIGSYHQKQEDHCALGTEWQIEVSLQPVARIDCRDGCQTSEAVEE